LPWGNPYVFTSIKRKDAHISRITRTVWKAILKEAKIVDLRVHEAIVIRTTYGKLKSIIPPFAFIGKVRYVDWTTERLPTLNMMEGVMHKRREYLDEREIRIVVQHMLLPGYGSGTPDGVTANGYLAPVDPVALVAELRLHPDSSPAFAEWVREFCAVHGLPAPRPSELAGDPTY
jgi:hypothetical protein